MKIYLFFIICIVFNPFISLAQHEADNWYFGNHDGLTFKDSTVASLDDGQLNTLEGCATISDKTTGELLFYTNGVTIWNRYHQVMDNGTGLKGGISSSQSVLITPNPADSFQYYVFTVPDYTNREIDTLASTDTLSKTSFYYSIVSLKTPSGSVISKNNFLIDSVAEKLTGTLDCSGNGYWVVVHHLTKSVFYSFHITKKGINLTPKTSSYISDTKGFHSGLIKISPNTLKIAAATTWDGISTSHISCLSLFDFDIESGAITNYKRLNADHNESGSFYGVEFSPDNTKLYTTTGTQSNTMCQYEVNLPDETSIRNSLYYLPVKMERIGKYGVLSNNAGGLQLAPNGKIYVAHYGFPYEDTSLYISVIEKPNLKGVNCSYNTNSGLSVGKSRFGLPNFMNYIFDGTGVAKQLSNSCIIPRAFTLPDSACTGTGLTFRDLSSFDQTSREWTFENGTPAISTDSIVSVTYSQAGSHKVRLIVSNANGSDTAFTTAIVFPIPVADAGQDTSICSNASSLIGSMPIDGCSYSWSPQSGLNNPSVANPVASPDTTTFYKVIVSNGHCIDSDFVTVTVVQPPVADAGNDTVICSGETILIGTQPIGGYSYSWTPTSGLSDPASAQTYASPTQTTSYILTVSNTVGCVSEDTVTVGIFSPSDGIFTLNPPTITILPGQLFQTQLHIPKGVRSWLVRLEYDKSVMKLNAATGTTNGITTTPSLEQLRGVSLQGTGGDGDVTLLFSSFLPHSEDSVFTLNLSVDSSQTTSCLRTSAVGATVELGEYCSKKLRRVSFTGKYYFLSPTNDKINFGIGLPGKVLLELYDYTGTLKEVIVDDEFDAGEYSIDLDLPTGVYFCRIQSGMYEDVKKTIFKHK